MILYYHNTSRRALNDLILILTLTLTPNPKGFVLTLPPKPTLTLRQAHVPVAPCVYCLAASSFVSFAASSFSQILMSRSAGLAFLADSRCFCTGRLFFFGEKF